MLWAMLVGTGHGERGCGILRREPVTLQMGEIPWARVKVLPQHTRPCVGMRNVACLLFET